MSGSVDGQLNLPGLARHPPGRSQRRHHEIKSLFECETQCPIFANQVTHIRTCDRETSPVVSLCPTWWCFPSNRKSPPSNTVFPVVIKDISDATTASHLTLPTDPKIDTARTGLAAAYKIEEKVARRRCFHVMALVLAATQLF